VVDCIDYRSEHHFNVTRLRTQFPKLLLLLPIPLAYSRSSPTATATAVGVASCLTTNTTGSAMRDEPEETSLSGLAGGCCFDFSKHSEHLFVVGTEEGRVHKCRRVASSIT
jgi:hypothetical protein